jgi:hypothetical protein
MSRPSKRKTDIRWWDEAVETLYAAYLLGSPNKTLSKSDVRMVIIELALKANDPEPFVDAVRRGEVLAIDWGHLVLLSKQFETGELTYTRRRERGSGLVKEIRDAILAGAYERCGRSRRIVAEAFGENESIVKDAVERLKKLNSQG